MSFSTSPDMITAAMMMRMSLQDNAFDASSFTTSSTSSVSPSIYSFSRQDSDCSAKSHIGSGGGLSRSRCVHNLSALGGNASETSIPLRHEKYASYPNVSWGYYADTPRS